MVRIYHALTELNDSKSNYKTVRNKSIVLVNKATIQAHILEQINF